MFTSKRLFPLSLPVILALAVSTPAHALTNPPHLHDPSRMLESDGKFYVYPTNAGIISSTDGLTWTSVGRLFPNGLPASFLAALPNPQGGFWAPDGIYANGQYYLYYSSADPDNVCAIGVVTTPTLDPAAANYKLTDRGVFVIATKSSTFCPIDPAPVLDKEGNLWVAWGGGYGFEGTDDTIWVTKADKSTGLAAAGEPKTGHPLEKGHKEGPYIYLHDGNYFLWWQEGGAFQNAERPYNMHVARSTSITGPYTGDRTFYPANNGTLTGPGHMGIYHDCGVERFTYHYYVNNTNPSLLGENELTWDADGWPKVGAASTTPIKPCGAMGGAGGASAGGAGAGGAGAGGASAGGASAGGASAGGASAGGASAGGASAGGASAGGASGAGGSAGSTAQAGGSNASGGSQSAGGSTGESGASAGGGTSAATGGTSAATGGAGGGPLGGGNAGTSASGSAGETTAPDDADSGCSCSVPSRSQTGGVWSALFAAAGAALLAVRSRRRSRKAILSRS